MWMYVDPSASQFLILLFFSFEEMYVDLSFNVPF
jgi:hypothetical protein